MTDEQGNASQDGGESTEALDTQGTDEGKTFTQAEIDKIVADRLSRQSKKYSDYEDLKTFKAQAEKARQASMSEQEQAIELARQESAKEVHATYATKLAAADIKAALTGLVENPDEVIEDLNLSRFLNEDDLSVNTEAVQALKAKYETLMGSRKKTTPNGFSPGKQSNGIKTGTPAEDFAAFINQFPAG